MKPRSAAAANVHDVHEQNVRDDDGAPAKTTSRDALWRVKVQPCGTAAAGVIAPTLDKYAPTVTSILAVAAIASTVISSVPAFRDQIRRSDIFRPPISLA